MSSIRRLAGIGAAVCLLAGWICTECMAAGVDPQAKALAADILKATGVRGGIVVHLGCGDGKLTAALRASDAYLVHGLDTDAGRIDSARRYIRSLGLYGPVSVDRWDGKRMPYTDNLVNLIVCEAPVDLSEGEAMRALAPRGVLYRKKGDTWAKTVKPWPDNMDEWTHYLHDATGNAVAEDTVVGPPKHMQWLAGPVYSRSHEIDTSISAMVSAGGRVFYILDEGLTGITAECLPEQWALIARDAFNGTMLWRQPVPDWGWPEWKKELLAGKDWTQLRGQRTRSPLVLPRRLVAEGDRVFVTLGYRAPISVLDAATGRVLRTCEGTECADEILVSGGVILTCIRTDPDNAAQRRGAKPVPEPIMALDADTGRVLWKAHVGRVPPLALAVGGGRVVLHNYAALVCLDLKTGKELWSVEHKGMRGGLWGSAHTLVVHDGVVLFLGPKRMLALSSEDGRKLWQAPGGRGPGVSNPPDLFVANGLVWYGGMKGKNHRQQTRVDKSGHDLRTGQVKKTVQVEKLITPGHHFRCYRSKATERFIMWTKRGVEFIDLEGDSHMRHDWLRAPCKYGFMPCNGLLYVPPHQCFCYPGVKLPGFNVLAGSVSVRSDGGAQRLERGPAYGHLSEAGPGASAGDWPTFRHDPRRSGCAGSDVPPTVGVLWQTALGDRITQPVVVGDRLYVALVDEHRVCCISADNGELVWDYTAGGRVDSSPTVFGASIMFGSADGHVYCLRASDGKLAWRFRAAPQDRRVAAFGQIESAWPVHGSVLVQNGIAYCSAGRSSYLDGGIHVYGLDPKTGKVLHKTCLDGPHPDVNKDSGWPFDMEGTRSDVLVSDGEDLYMYQAVMDGKLEQREAPRLSGMGHRRVGRHLTTTGGFLDGSGWNRTFWMYSECWPGFYIANQSPKAGQMLVFDDSTTYAVKCFTRRNCHSPMFFPGREGYLLFADANDTEPVLVGDKGDPKAVQWLPYEKYASSRGATGIDATAIDRDKGVGFSRPKPPRWKTWVPIRVRAMVVAGETLFISGPPDVVDPKDPLAAFEGRKGGLLWAVSTRDGRKLSEQKLDSPPVFDGLVAAGNRLYMTTRNGRLICLGQK